jgi:hypothetical protein
MSEIDELHARIVRLEDRLENYHEWLESSLEENTRFQLHATWGIVISANFIVGMLLTLWLAPKWWAAWFGEKPGFLIQIAIGAAAFAVGSALSMWAVKGRESDEKKLYRWPTWIK